MATDANQGILYRMPPGWGLSSVSLSSLFFEVSGRTSDQRNKCPSSEAVLFLFSSDALLTFGRSSKNSLPEEFFYSCFVAPEKLFQYPFETSKSFCRHICG